MGVATVVGLVTPIMRPDFEPIEIGKYEGHYFNNLVSLTLRQPHEYQSLDRPSILDVFLDDLLNVILTYLPIKHAVRIYHHGGPHRAEPDRAAFGQQDLARRISALLLLTLPEAFRLEHAGEFVPNVLASYSPARFTRADENLSLYRGLQHRGELFELVPVGYVLLFRHHLYFATKGRCAASKHLGVMLRFRIDARPFSR